MEKRLFEASLDGNINILLKLLQEDPLILDRVTLARHGDTPLHIASMLGHVDFVKEVITRKPYLAIERDAQNRVPLHVASAKGHTAIVKLLISANPETCLVRDGDGRNPLHLAAIKGWCEVVKELVQAQPHAARAMVQQDTILHLCVQHNQLEVLKLLVETVGDHEFVNTKDADGNTILHLAVAHKQIETINFLILNTTIEVNASNTNGETLMDILAKGPRDVKDQQIIWALKRARVVDANNESMLEQIFQNSRGMKKSDDWIDKKRNALMVVASLIATMAFQAGIKTPGGVWQDDDLTVDPPKKAGYAVMANDYQIAYHTFLISNTVGFISTLSIILLLISGLPFLKGRFFMWILMVIMWVATASMSLTYLISIFALTPNIESHTLSYVVCGIVLVWFVLVTLLAVGHAFQILKFFKKLMFPGRPYSKMPKV
ncbi:uncharacterized protein LOC143538961 isoform X1 [Bidens hawaiensis]|uniref:uncharacterized protein LOC143538961 isoform X1 n=1 Tax=Bidens hawaiensis TaxID=980011 RepID=UPI00404B834D